MLNRLNKKINRQIIDLIIQTMFYQMMNGDKPRTNKKLL